ncbi:MAG: bifunctional (p)ppGpp synthetase/guanosine-3',5'-bis(diphosphate) 3'-pyrophosphohydrolase [Prevotellaceae bacterium]|nr:bifunctional (p)ppGpp synthetase/guanosine-3',5'-bis(diphosphate) 3'-pyrophosphohydrolase [Candidatus Faecinaster equi]
MTEQEIQDEKLVEEAFQKLINTYLSSNHRKKVDLITRAFNFAKQAHKGVRRRSGEPYILHPIAVAQIVCGEIGMGSTSICAALLHDVEEDTDYTYEDIKNLFGEKIANIVEGLTKISGGIFGDRASLQAETFKKLLLTMSDDIRVILVKISDRLHNMRTLASMLPNKQYKIAGETLYIYAPIADRLGLNKIKTELENLSFKYEHPDEYQMLLNKLEQAKEHHDNLFNDFTPPIRKALDKLGLKYEIKVRIKSPYSIWRKMQKKNITFEEVFDLLAIRIVFDSIDISEEVNDCFRIYVAITSIYKSHPDRLRDWVNHPRSNGYRALHTTLMSNNGEWIEVQIRSRQMDDVAENGLAAHWKYKSNSQPEEIVSEEYMDRWIHTIKEILDDPQPDTLDLLDTIKLNLYAKEIVVFTPKGEIKELPSGATVLDFAFYVHTMLGAHCIGAKVNHKLEPIMYKLSSGDQVEILTSQSQQVSPEWLEYITTAKAKSKVAALLRKINRESVRKGEIMLTEFLQENKLLANYANIERLRNYHRMSSPFELHKAIGEGLLVLNDSDIEFLVGANKKKNKWYKHIPFINNSESEEKTIVENQDKKAFILGINRKKVLEINDSNIQFCDIHKGCLPIIGDDVLGYLDQELLTLTIHKRSCPEATELKSKFGNNIIAIKWNITSNYLFSTTIQIEGIDTEGILLRIAEQLYENDLKLKVDALNIESHDGLFVAKLTVRVHSTNDIYSICNRLSNLKGITSAKRA